MPVRPFDEVDGLLWATLRLFEEQAQRQYESSATQLMGEDKGSFVARVASAAEACTSFEQSPLQAPMRDLLASAEAVTCERDVLIVQGLVLERVREVIYRFVGASAGASDETRAMAGVGRATSDAIVRTALTRLGQLALTVGPLFPAFVERSDDVLHKLDAVGECVDEVFGSRFDLRFADVVGEFVADLVPACVFLGMDRRKVMGHLAGALMEVVDLLGR